MLFFGIFGLSKSEDRAGSDSSKYVCRGVDVLDTQKHSSVKRHAEFADSACCESLSMHKAEEERRRDIGATFSRVNSWADCRATGYTSAVSGICNSEVAVSRGD